jgi:hypothetical protein
MEADMFDAEKSPPRPQTDLAETWKGGTMSAIPSWHEHELGLGAILRVHGMDDIGMQHMIIEASYAHAS